MCREAGNQTAAAADTYYFFLCLFICYCSYGGNTQRPKLRSKNCFVGCYKIHIVTKNNVFDLAVDVEQGQQTRTVREEAGTVWPHGLFCLRLWHRRWWLIWLGLAIPSSSNHFPVHPCALAAMGTDSSSCQRFCPSYISLSPTSEVSRASLPLATISFWVAKLIFTYSLGQPRTGCNRVYHSAHVVFLSAGVGSGHRGCSRPFTIYNLMYYVTKRGEHSIWYVQAWVLVYKVTESRCVLSASWLRMWVPACPSPCIKSHHFHLVVL